MQFFARPGPSSVSSACHVLVVRVGTLMTAAFPIVYWANLARHTRELLLFAADRARIAFEIGTSPPEVCSKQNHLVVTFGNSIVTDDFGPIVPVA
jgi:hypothetical protein